MPEKKVGRDPGNSNDRGDKLVERAKDYDKVIDNRQCQRDPRKPNVWPSSDKKHMKLNRSYSCH